MLNRIILRGYLGRNPEIKTMQNGKQMATCFLATNFSWKDEDREWQTHTDWHRVTIFRASSIGWIKDGLKKGDLVYLEGKLSYHSWTDKYNQKRFMPHIVIEDYHGHFERLRSRKASEIPSSLTEEQDLREACPLEETLEETPAFINRKRDFHTFPTPSQSTQPS